MLPAGSAPYLVPYAAFLALVELQARVPAFGAPLFALRVALPAVLLAWFWQRGAYRELAGHRLGAMTLADLAAGLGIAVLWVGPFLVWPALERGDAFDPLLLGSAPATLALRFVGFVVITPLVEELFVRSFLFRYAPVFAADGDFRKQPIAKLSGVAFVTTLLWFTFTHEQWEWPVAFAAGAALNGWLGFRKHLVACVLAHAAANAAIFALVVLGPYRLWEFL